MTSTHFPEANTRYGPPPDLTDAQCGTIYAHEAAVERGSVEGAHMVITAWKPDARELEALNAGAPVFMTMLGGGLAPHFLSTSFDVASNPA